MHKNLVKLEQKQSITSSYINRMVSHGRITIFKYIQISNRRGHSGIALLFIKQRLSMQAWHRLESWGSLIGFGEDGRFLRRNEGSAHQERFSAAWLLP